MNIVSLRLILVPLTANDVLFAANREKPEQLTFILTRIAMGLPDHRVRSVDVVLAPVVRFVDAEGNEIPCPENHHLDLPEPPVGLKLVVDLGGQALGDWLPGYARYIAANTFAELQSDLSLQPALWASSRAFGTRSQAVRLVGADRLGLGNSLHRVNVVIVDAGFDAGLFPGHFGGGCIVGDRRPGQGSSRHAAMIARTVLDIAPDALLFDVPLLPTPSPGARAVLYDLPAFTSQAAHIFSKFSCLSMGRNATGDTGPWVFANAWAVFDSRSDVLAPRYCTDRAHILNKAVLKLVGQGYDMVFAAGNCGQFDPDLRCRQLDTGPCHSILGANSLDAVLTVGAVRVDLTPLGYSSQGPGQPGLGSDKPDVHAPAQFADDDDAASVHGGTSAACAVAAGVVAALRARWSQTECSPADLKAALVQTARSIPIGFPGVNVGVGMADAAAAAVRLAIMHP